MKLTKEQNNDKLNSNSFFIIPTHINGAIVKGESLTKTVPRLIFEVEENGKDLQEGKTKLKQN